MAANAGAIRAGQAYVELSLRDRLGAGLAAAEKRLRAFANGLQSIGSTAMNVGRQVFALGVMFTAPFAATILAASRAEESLNKFRQVFGTQAQAAEEFVDTLSATVGRSRVEIMDSMSAFNSIFIGLGFGAERSRELSQSLSRASIDFASFHNIADDESVRRFIAAMAGSAVVLDQFGVNLRESELNQELLRQGINKTTETATEQEKTIARVGLIMRVMGQQGAAGDAVRTAGSFANMLKRLKSDLLDVAVAIGQSLMPAAVGVMSDLSKLGGWLVDFIKKNQALVRMLAVGAASLIAAGAALMVFGGTVVAAGMFLTNLLAILAAVKVTLGVILSPLGLFVIALGAAAAGAAYLSRETEAAGRVLEWLGGAFGRLEQTAFVAWGGIVDAVAAGDLALAGRVAWLGLQVLALDALAEIEAGWDHLQVYLINAWEDLADHAPRVVGFINGAWSGMTATLTSEWASAISAMQGLWDGFFGTVSAELGLLGGAISGFTAGDKETESPASQQDRMTEAAINRMNREFELMARDFEREAARDARMVPLNDAIRDAQIARLEAEWDTWSREFLRGSLGDMGGGGAGAGAARGSVTGTFSAAGLATLGTGGAAERTARNTEQAVRILAGIEKLLADDVSLVEFV